jgi:hypothetical protein
MHQLESCAGDNEIRVGGFLLELLQLARGSLRDNSILADHPAKLPNPDNLFRSKPANAAAQR